MVGRTRHGDARNRGSTGRRRREQPQSTWVTAVQKPGHTDNAFFGAELSAFPPE